MPKTNPGTAVIILQQIPKTPKIKEAIAKFEVLIDLLSLNLSIRCSLVLSLRKTKKKMPNGKKASKLHAQ